MKKPTNITVNNGGGNFCRFHCIIVLVVLSMWAAGIMLYVLPKHPDIVPGNWDYLIRTDGCVIPDYDPWHTRIKRLYSKPPIEINCNPQKLAPLSIADQDGLRVTRNPSDLRGYSNNLTSLEQLSCCYRKAYREQQMMRKYDLNCDKKYKLGDCIEMNTTNMFPVDAQAALVVCDHKTSGEILYKNVHYFFPSGTVKEKLAKFKKTKTDDISKRPLNFFLIGIDSTSRQNLRRFMPKTFKFLNDDVNTIDFKAFNKIGENTDPNLTAILSGIDPDLLLDFKHQCYKHRMQSLDGCPFIWKRFSDRGYVTATAEDWPDLNFLHYMRIGFVKAPSDFYMRPYAIMSENEINGPTNLRACDGVHLAPEVVMNYANKFIERYNNEVPLFGFFFSTSVTHKFNQNVANLDKVYLDFFTKFYRNGHNNNSVLLFLSDHGMRFGKIRSTHIGGIEERMPFVMMTFPPWFKDLYPNTWNNLQINQNRLTANYDIYLTIRDIVEQSFYEFSKRKKTAASGFGQSLFTEIPRNRTCKMAGIPEHFCACQLSAPVSINSREVAKAATVFLDFINKEVLAPHRRCSQLTLDKIIDAQQSTIKIKTKIKQSDGKTKLVDQTGTWKTFTIILQTNPGLAQFEATVHREDKSWSASPQFSRVNLYGNQSSCVVEPQLKLVCYCV